MWIKDYREREGLELYQLQQRVNTYSRLSSNPLQAPVSAQLIHMLEEQKDAVTHPHIADCIAAVCGATAKQRDMIVHRIHRGEWVPTDETRNLAKEANKANIGYTVDAPAARKRKPPANKRAVVKVDICANIVDRFSSVSDAAKEAETRKANIRSRCQRRVVHEFRRYRDNNGNYIMRIFTYRYADEWDSMTREQRIADVNFQND